MRYVFLITLVVMVLGTAVGIIVARHDSRESFIELQALKQNRDVMQIEWGRLQLELGTWATHGRIERLARTQLGMTNPGIDIGAEHNR